MLCSCTRPPCGFDHVNSERITDRPLRTQSNVYVHELEEDEFWKAADDLLLQDGAGSSKARELKDRGQPQERVLSVEAGSSSGEGSLGLDIDIVDSVSAVVVGIRPGLVQRWNSGHPDAALEEGDRIVEINGTFGNAAMIADHLKRDTEWQLLVQRPVEVVVASSQLWRLASSREGGCSCRPHGLHVGFAEHGTSLMIDKIHEGLMMRWNQANPEQAVKVKDRIIEVNGKRGQASDLVDTLCSSAESLRLVIRRYPSLGPAGSGVTALRR